MKLEAKHLDALMAQGSIEHLRPFLTEDRKKTLEASTAFAALSDEGKVLMTAGIVDYWPNRGEVWAIFDKKICRRDFLAIHNGVKRFLDVCGVNRIEAAVEVNFKEGHRWAKALGFELEAKVMRAYLPDGKDCSLYARVRKHG